MQRPAYALSAGEGSSYSFGVNFTVKAGESSGGAGAAVMEYATAKGEEPPDHTHETEDEMFYVLEGAVSFRAGDETFDVERGGFVFLPSGVEHGYTIRSDGEVRLLVITSPSRPDSRGWGGFVADVESSQS